MTADQFNNVVSGLRPRLVAFAASFVKRGPATADDMVQDAVIKLWNSNKRDTINKPEALAMMILRNVCLDYIKLKKNNSEELNVNFNLSDRADPLSYMEGKDKVGVLRRCMDSLPYDQMLALRLRDVMGYEMEEIAKILNTSEGNVRTLLSRARKKMKEKLLRHGKNI